MGADASWPLFCAHVLGALIEHAPAKTRLQLAADAYTGLKAAAAYASTASPSSSSVVVARSSDNTGGGSSLAVSPAAPVSTRSAADADADAGASSREGTEEGIGISTRKAAAFAVGAIYGRLETARRAATELIAVGATEMVVEGASGAVAVSA